MGPQGSVFEGRTLDEAVRKGLDALGLSRAEVMITMLEEGSGGFLGIGSRPYKVRIAPRPGGAPSEPEAERDSDRRRRDRGGRGERRDRGGRGGRREGSDRGRRDERGGRREDRPVRADDRPRDDRPRDDRPRDDRPRGDRPREGRPYGDRGAHREDRPMRSDERREGGGDRGRREGRREYRHDDRGPRREDRPMRSDERREMRRGDERPMREVRREDERPMREEPREGRREERRYDERFEERPEAAMGQPADEPTEASLEAGAGAAPEAEGGPMRHRDDDDRRRRRRGRRGGRGRGGLAPTQMAMAVGSGEPGGPQAAEGEDAMEGASNGDRAAGGSPERGAGLSAEQLEAEGRRWTEQLLSAMGFEATVSARADGDHVDVSLQVANDDQLLTGPKGEVREALQHLLNRMINRGEGSRYHLQLEINDFWQHRESELAEVARGMAERAIEAGDEVVSEYLNAQERRVIHQTLKADPRVKTYALGTGMIKRIAVAPAGFAGRSNEYEE
jgi:predicted RNA-binding protein Jag